MIAPTYYLCDIHPTTSPMLEKVDSRKKTMDPYRIVVIPNKKKICDNL